MVVVVMTCHLLFKTQQRPVAVPLNFVLNNEKVKELIEKPEIQAELLPMLPEGMQTIEELRATLVTPQFQMALRRLSAACMSGQYNDIMSNFQLNPADGAEHLMQGMREEINSPNFHRPWALFTSFSQSTSNSG